MRCRRFDKGVTCNLIRIVVALDAMHKPPATDFVVATNAAEAASRAWGWTPPHEETEEGSKAISHIEKEDVVRYILTSQPKEGSATSKKAGKALRCQQREEKGELSQTHSAGCASGG